MRLGRVQYPAVQYQTMQLPKKNARDDHLERFFTTGYSMRIRR